MQALSYQRDILSQMKERDIYNAIYFRREIIRWHRDQKGDDRCWLDDYKIYAMVTGTPLPPTKIPAEVGMVLCQQFYRYSRLDYKLPNHPGAILDPNHWNDDIFKMRYLPLLDELERIQLKVLEFAKTPWPRTPSVYQKLYDLLPEKIRADFRLPPESEFLGGIKPETGCPNFWQSHSVCKVQCNLHNWGPCK